MACGRWHGDCERLRVVVSRILVSEQHRADASKRIRVLQPAERLAERHGLALSAIEGAWDGRRMAAGVVEQANVVYLHMLDLNLSAVPMLDALFSLAKTHRVPIVVDADDTYFRPADHGDFDAQLSPHLETMKHFVGRADRVTVTGPALADDLSPWAKATAVLPNWIDLQEYRLDDEPGAPTSETTATGPRVGFAGGSTHLHDLVMILPAIAAVQRTQPFEFVIFGLYDRDLRASAQRVLTLGRREVERAGLQAFAALAQGLSRVRYRHVPSVPYGMFPSALATLALDIGLCPLRDSHFNRCRSAVKYYQYAATGAATLASDVVPFRGECPNLVENDTTAWRAALLALVADPALRRATAMAQAADVGERRTWQALAPRYGTTLLGLRSADVSPLPASG